MTVDSVMQSYEREDSRQITGEILGNSLWMVQAGGCSTWQTPGAAAHIYLFGEPLKNRLLARATQTERDWIIIWCANCLLKSDKSI